MGNGGDGGGMWNPLPTKWRFQLCPTEICEFQAENALHVAGPVLALIVIIIIRHGISDSTSSSNRRKHIQTVFLSDSKHQRATDMGRDIGREIRGSLSVCESVHIFRRGNGHKWLDLWVRVRVCVSVCVCTRFGPCTLQSYVCSLTKTLSLSYFMFHNVLLDTRTPLSQYFITWSLLLWRLPNYITTHISCWFINESLKWMSVLVCELDFPPVSLLWLLCMSHLKIWKDVFYFIISFNLSLPGFFSLEGMFLFLFKLSAREETHSSKFRVGMGGQYGDIMRFFLSSI